MRPFSILAIIFLIVPVIELYLLIQAGGVIGVFPTIALVILTAVLGAALLRSQGLATLSRFQDSMQRQELPAFEILEGITLLLGGLLLLTPGFLTDALGFMCLLPFSRRAIVKILLPKMILVASRHSPLKTASRKGEGRVIEGEYTRKRDH